MTSQDYKYELNLQTAKRLGWTTRKETQNGNVYFALLDPEGKEQSLMLSPLDEDVWAWVPDYASDIRHALGLIASIPYQMKHYIDVSGYFVHEITIPVMGGFITYKDRSLATAITVAWNMQYDESVKERTPEWKLKEMMDAYEAGFNNA